MLELKHKPNKKSKEVYKRFNQIMFLYKIRFWSFKLNYLNKLKYKKYCKKGYHKISSSHRSSTNSNGLTKEVHYMECSVCKTKWFVSKKDKKTYIELEESWNDIMSSHFKSIINDIKDGKKEKEKLYNKSS